MTPRTPVTPRTAPSLPPTPWAGRSIRSTHAPDGVVRAPGRGAVAAGPDEDDPMAALGAAVREREVAALAGTDRHTP